MTDKSETPASTGSQRDTPSRSTTKRISRTKNAAAVETKDQTDKAPGRKRAAGDAVARRVSKVKAADAAPTLRTDPIKTPTPGVVEKHAAAEPAVATTVDAQRNALPTRAAERDIAPAERRAMIERIAYFRAEWRGWTPGAELDDWLHAEREVDAMLRGDYTA